MTERWAPVREWEGFYEVSDQGRVRSVARVVTRGGGPMKVAAKLLRIRNPAPAFYSMVNLSGGGHRRSAYVHRLVLEAFVGPAPEGMETLHRNGIRDDCRLGNLHWGPHAENLRDIARHGRGHGRGFGTHCARGHEFTADNTLTPPSGSRRCRTCANVWAAARRARVGAVDSDLDRIATAVSR